MLAKSKRYYYDACAIKEPAHSRGPRGGSLLNDTGREEAVGRTRWKGERANDWGENGRNKRSVWTVATKPYPGSHFATFPQELVRPCILAGSPAGGTVLDPFGGSGTVAMVAMQERRDSIYIDLNREYLDIALRRCGFDGSKLIFDQYEVKEV